MGVLVKQAAQCLLCWGRGSHGLHAHSCCNTHLVPHVILSLILLTHPLNFPEPPASLVLCASYIPSLSLLPVRKALQEERAPAPAPFSRP